MTEATPSMPIVCILQALIPEERSRSRSLRAELAAAVRETVDLSSGYAFRIGPDSAVFEAAASWIALERRCCPFLSFELRWPHGEHADAWLTITGPEGTKSFLAAEMPQLSTAK